MQEHLGFVKGTPGAGDFWGEVKEGNVHRQAHRGVRRVTHGRLGSASELTCSQQKSSSHRRGTQSEGRGKKHKKRTTSNRQRPGRPTEDP